MNKNELPINKKPVRISITTYETSFMESKEGDILKESFAIDTEGFAYWGRSLKDSERKMGYAKKIRRYLIDKTKASELIAKIIENIPIDNDIVLDAWSWKIAIYYPNDKRIYNIEGSIRTYDEINMIKTMVKEQIL